MVFLSALPRRVRRVAFVECEEHTRWQWFIDVLTNQLPSIAWALHGFGKIPVPKAIQFLRKFDRHGLNPGSMLWQYVGFKDAL